MGRSLFTLEVIQGFPFIAQGRLLNVHEFTPKFKPELGLCLLLIRERFQNFVTMPQTQEVVAETFRADLFHWLNVSPLIVPPLR